MIKHEYLNEDEINNIYITQVNRCEKISSGSIFAYDKNGNKYFIINQLVEKFNKLYFDELSQGIPMFILAIEDVWIGPKWKNKVVQAVIYISNNIESINRYMSLNQEILETCKLILELRLRLLEIISEPNEQIDLSNLNIDFEDIFENKEINFLEIEKNKLWESRNKEVQTNKEILDNTILKLFELRNERENMFK
ncbi:hypothetical protein [Aquirufa aurantiipilula]